MKRKRGRPRTAHLRLMHLASCIDDWVERSNRQRGSVKDAMLDHYEMQYGGWSAEDVAATGLEKPRDVHAFLRTTKTDLKLGRRMLREWQQHLRSWRWR